MIKIETEFSEVFILEPKLFKDNRGWFTEIWSKKDLRDLGVEIDFVQENQSYSKDKGILRGLHFQLEPKAQAKLIRCTRGAIRDIVVDIRKGSPTYCMWVSVELSSENMRQLFIPKGFAHGFITLADDVEVQYKVDEYYSPEHDRGIAWNDPIIAVDWCCENPILSDKDKSTPTLADSDVNFIY